ncbi:hypothetical protein HMPREF0005_05759, partial [Achromobacter xylosoxidans C54]
EQELAQRLAAAEAQQAELMAQQKARDAQLLELTRHLISAPAAPPPASGGGAT